MDIRTKEIYSEVYSILNLLGNNYVSNLPDSLYNMIKQEKLESYNPKYVDTLNLEEQNIKKESIAMIALFHLNYWCNSNEEKEELRKVFKDNEDKHQAKLREKYNTDNIFKNRYQIKEEQQNATKNNAAIIEYKESTFRRILNKIRNIFCFNKDI